jgi:hypothetical protein
MRCVKNGLIKYAEKMNCNAKRKFRTAGRTTLTWRKQKHKMTNMNPTQKQSLQKHQAYF